MSSLCAHLTDADRSQRPSACNPVAGVPALPIPHAHCEARPAPVCWVPLIQGDQYPPMPPAVVVVCKSRRPLSKTKGRAVLATLFGRSTPCTRASAVGIGLATLRTGSPVSKENQPVAAGDGFVEATRGATLVQQVAQTPAPKKGDPSRDEDMNGRHAWRSVAGETVDDLEHSQVPWSESCCQWRWQTLADQRRHPA